LTKQKFLREIPKHIRSYKGLYWYMGFGIKPLLILFALLIMFLFTEVEDYWIMIALIISIFGYMIYKAYKWNYHKWKRIYNRGLFIFQEIKEHENHLSTIENRDYNPNNALLLLAGVMLEDYEGEISNKIVDRANELKGSIYLEYIKNNITHFFSEYDKGIFIELENKFNKMQVDACMILIQVIEIKHGSREATKLAIHEYESH